MNISQPQVLDQVPAEVILEEALPAVVGPEEVVLVLASESCCAFIGMRGGAKLGDHLIRICTHVNLL